MTAVRARWASQLRARGRAWLSLALLLGLAGGVALAAAAQRPADRTPLLLALLSPTWLALDLSMAPARVLQIVFYEGAVSIGRLAAQLFQYWKIPPDEKQ